MDPGEAQGWADEFLDERLAPPRPVLLGSLAVAGPGSGFSPFLPEDAERAREVIPRAQLGVWHGRLLDGARRGRLLNSSGQEFDAGIDELGHATEPSRARGQQADASRVPDPSRYGGFHGLGRVFLSLAAGDPTGVMADTDTAIRDPVFYRWHRRIDDLGFEWQQRQEPHDLSAHAAEVRLRHGPPASAERPGESVDLILIRESELPGGFGDPGFASRVQDAVGGQHWNEELSATAPGTDELQTEMLLRRLEIEPPIPGGPEGMRFWLAAVVTDGAGDQVAGSTCGSMSFCGARERYPDRRPMGYPFDRPLSGGEIAAALGELDLISTVTHKAPCSVLVCRTS